MNSDPSDEAVNIGRWSAWLRRLQRRLFAIGWASAVVIATAGWFYFIFRIIWYFVGSLLP